MQFCKCALASIITISGSPCQLLLQDSMVSIAFSRTPPCLSWLQKQY